MISIPTRPELSLWPYCASRQLKKTGRNIRALLRMVGMRPERRSSNLKYFGEQIAKGRASTYTVGGCRLTPECYVPQEGKVLN